MNYEAFNNVECSKTRLCWSLPKNHYFSKCLVPFCIDILENPRYYAVSTMKLFFYAIASISNSQLQNQYYTLYTAYVLRRRLVEEGMQLVRNAIEATLLYDR